MCNKNCVIRILAQVFSILSTKGFRQARFYSCIEGTFAAPRISQAYCFPSSKVAEDKETHRFS